jgi:hypothetical protein
MSGQLPAVLQPGALVPVADTYSVPVLIADASEQAANINNPHTRRAYARACARFFAWCEQRGLTLAAIRPSDVAAWVNALQETEHAGFIALSVPVPRGAGREAAARGRALWLITGQVVPFNPASAVRGPEHVVKTGKTRCSTAPSGAATRNAADDCRPLGYRETFGPTSRRYARILRCQ